MDGYDPATDPWWYPDDCPGEATPFAAAAAGDDEFLDIGEDNAGDGPMLKSEPSTMAMGMTESKRKLRATDGMHDVKDTNITSDSSERRKAASGSSNRTRLSRHSDTHNVTEKRRRCKITDRLRTLQQLVPGCEKSNQASTLEQTIQYMKSLQQQVQEMKVSPVQAVYPVMQAALAPAIAMPLAPPDAVAPGTVAAGGRVPILPAGMAPFRAMLPYPPYYHAVMVPAPAYRPQPVASAAPEGQCLVSTEQRCNKERRRRRRL
ncbi:hypothetical protein D1007_30146 [Hordeum vulgare]|nr:hypothetical protein D1007_30146 [Hordeum vulgare]